jgi:hypothetical protein
MSWYWTVLLVLVATVLLASTAEQRIKNLNFLRQAERLAALRAQKVSGLDQSMVLSIIASALTAGVAPQIAIRAGLNYLPRDARAPYLAFAEGIELEREEDFLMKNLEFILQSVDNGNQVASVLQNKIEVFQIKHKIKLLTKIKKAEVWMLAPLGLCFLPTFILLTIIPLLASMLGNFFN